MLVVVLVFSYLREARSVVVVAVAAVATATAAVALFAGRWDVPLRFCSALCSPSTDPLPCVVLLDVS